MSFTGKYMQEERHENYDGYMSALGCPAEMIEKFRDFKVMTEMEQGGTFRWSKVLPDRTWTNTFTIGEECELENNAGMKFMTTVIMDGGKLKIQFPKYLYTAQVDGDMLTEVNTLTSGGPVLTTFSKRM